MLEIASDPLPMQPEMFNLVGEIVVHWSRIESQIDMDIHGLRQWGIVKKLAKDVPHTFAKKCELWRRSIRALYPKIEVYQNYADAFKEAVGKVVKMATTSSTGLGRLSRMKKVNF